MNPLIQEILDLVEELQAKMQELQDKVNDALSRVPFFLDWVVDKIHDAWDWLVQKWNEFWDAADLIFSNMGSPEAIDQVTQGWSDSIGSPVSAQVQNADRALLGADDHWEGQAADAYFPKANLHKAAMENVQTNYVDGANSALDTVRSGLTKFYMGLITALGALIAGFIGAITASGTIVGIPAGILIAAGACLVAIGAFYTGGTLLKSDCTTAKNDLNNKQGNNAGFPNGAWPPGAILTA